jgi:hypothetical protein
MASVTWGAGQAHPTSRSRPKLPNMKTVEFWLWLIPTPSLRGMKTVKTRYRMDEATALEHHPEAMKAPGSMERRNVPDTDADLQANFTSAWLRSK